MSIMVAVGKGANAGVLVRNAEALEKLAAVNLLIIDKTGTVTEGRPKVQKIDVGERANLSQDEVLGLAASVENFSEHPLARAIVRAANEKNLSIAAATDFRSAAGGGVEARVGSRMVLVGKRDFLKEHAVTAAQTREKQIEFSEPSNAARDAEIEQDTRVYVARDGALVGSLTFEDQLKANAALAIRELKQDGVQVAMLSGDNEAAAKKIARMVDIEEAHGGANPDSKAEFVKSAKRNGKIVAMAGDGVNDAPALAAADVGIAMGTGTDVAIESAGITLLKGDLNGILRARKLSRATIRNIKQNLLFAFVYNALGIPIAAGVLYPIFGWLLSPMIASAAMSFSSVSVIANALRLRSQKL
jgi:Cu+-exporting ATPase